MDEGPNFGAEAILPLILLGRDFPLVIVPVPYFSLLLYFSVFPFLISFSLFFLFPYILFIYLFTSLFNYVFSSFHLFHGCYFSYSL
jgi:hypothetical protein